MEAYKENPIIGMENTKEGTDEPDFVGVYEQRLAAAKSVSGSEKELAAFDYRDIGLKIIEKRIPVVVFEWGQEQDPEYNLWMLPDNDPTKRLSHEIIRDDLSNHIGQNNENIGLGPFSAYILIGSGDEVDSQTTTYLAVHESFARIIEMESQELANDAFAKKWQNFLEKYKVDSIVGEFETALSVGKQSKKGSPKEVLNVDIVGRMMENTELMKIAKEAHLTNYGMMRLFLEYYAAKKINRSYDCRANAARLAGETKKHPYEHSEE